MAADQLTKKREPFRSRLNPSRCRLAAEITTDNFVSANHFYTTDRFWPISGASMDHLSPLANNDNGRAVGRGTNDTLHRHGTADRTADHNRRRSYHHTSKGRG